MKFHKKMKNFRFQRNLKTRIENHFMNGFLEVLKMNRKVKMIQIEFYLKQKL